MLKGLDHTALEGVLGLVLDQLLDVASDYFILWYLGSCSQLSLAVLALSAFTLCLICRICFLLGAESLLDKLPHLFLLFFHLIYSCYNYQHRQSHL